MLGQLIANGRTSDVYRFGADSAAKVLSPATPQHWAEAEAVFTTAVRGLGIPAPEVRDVTVIDGRAAVIFERVDGPSMWQKMLDQPTDVSTLVRQLVTIQRSIHEAGVPDGLPSLVDRLRLKCSASNELDADERASAAELLDQQPVGGAVLHGDFHPGNVLLGQDGPVVIDWFDATVGHPTADIARTLLLLSGRATDLRHLPGATPDLITSIQTEFAASVRGSVSPTSLHTWRRLRAAGRLAERTDLDVSGLLAIWRDTTPSSVAGDD